jgi:hypothetical protein
MLRFPPPRAGTRAPPTDTGEMGRSKQRSDACTTDPRVYAAGARIAVQNALLLGRERPSALIVPWGAFRYAEKTPRQSGRNDGEPRFPSQVEQV